MPSKTPLTGGHWETIEHEHVYIKNGAIAAGHIPSDRHDTTSEDVDDWVKQGHAVKMFPQDNEVRKTTSDFNTLDEHEEAYDQKVEQYESRNDLTDEHKSAIDDYVGDDYKPINEHLRNSGADYQPSVSSDDYNERRTALLQEAINNSPVTDRDQILHRHFTIDPNHKVGDVIKNAGIHSTSTLTQKRFVRDLGGFGYEIAVPSGSKGVFTGMNKDELEVMLGHGSRFKVLDKKDLVYDVNGSRQPRTIYQLLYLGPGEK